MFSKSPYCRSKGRISPLRQLKTHRDSFRHAYPTAQKLPCSVAAMIRSLVFCLTVHRVEEAVGARKDREMAHWKCAKTPDRRLSMGRICGRPLQAGYGPWLLFLGCEAEWGSGGCCCMPVTFAHRAALEKGSRHQLHRKLHSVEGLSLKLGCQTGCSKMGKNQISVYTLCQTLFLC